MSTIKVLHENRKQPLIGELLNSSSVGMFNTKSVNESSYRDIMETIQKNEQEVRRLIVEQYKNDILSIALNDHFESGTVSSSENYITTVANDNNVSYICEAFNELYLEYYKNEHVLTSILIMLGTLSYEQVFPQGQTMALGLLQHSDIAIRDRAVQLFERWNSKKGIPLLRKQHSDCTWLQRYINTVLMYLERDGVD